MEQEAKKYGLKDELNARWNTFKWNAQKTSRKVKNTVCKWCAENPEAVTTLVVGAAFGTAKLCKTMAKNSSIRMEQNWKNTHIYDHSTGRYVELRRKLKGSEYAAVLDRKETTGKSLSVILAEMGFLK